MLCSKIIHYNFNCIDWCCVIQAEPCCSHRFCFAEYRIDIRIWTKQYFCAMPLCSWKPLNPLQIAFCGGDCLLRCDYCVHSLENRITVIVSCAVHVSQASSWSRSSSWFHWQTQSMWTCTVWVQLEMGWSDHLEFKLWGTSLWSFKSWNLISPILL